MHIDMEVGEARDLLADEWTVVLADNGVVKLLRVPVTTHWVPETRAHNIDTVLVVHGLIVGGYRELAGCRRRLRVWEKCATR